MNTIEKLIMIITVITGLISQIGCGQSGTITISVTNATQASLNGEYEISNIEAIDWGYEISIHCHTDCEDQKSFGVNFGNSENAEHVEHVGLVLNGDLYECDDSECENVIVDLDQKTVKLNKTLLTDIPTGKTLKVSSEFSFLPIPPPQDS